MSAAGAATLIRNTWMDSRLGGKRTLGRRTLTLKDIEGELAGGMTSPIFYANWRKFLTEVTQWLSLRKSWNFRSYYYFYKIQTVVSFFHSKNNWHSKISNIQYLTIKYAWVLLCPHSQRAKPISEERRLNAKKYIENLWNQLWCETKTLSMLYHDYKFYS